MLELLSFFSVVLHAIASSPVPHTSTQLNLSEITVAPPAPLNELLLERMNSTNVEHNDLDITCFHQEQGGRPLGQTNVVDCTYAMNRVVTSVVPAHYVFRRTYRYPFPLPKTFPAGSCNIWLDMTSNEAEDSFELADIVVAASRIVGKCVAGAPALGGKTLVGPKKLMEIFVFGKWRGVEEE
ncbi:hypothetical protein ACLMJK_007488 [Lecanora helva]